MGFDLDKIKKGTADIRAAVDKIRGLVSAPDQAFWADERNILSVERLMLIILEAVGNLSLHVLAKKFKKSADAPAECIEFLAAENIFNEDLSGRLRRAMRFRNILVHRYWEVDRKKVYEYAQNNLKDFEDFLESINKLTKLA